MYSSLETCLGFEIRFSVRNPFEVHEGIAGGFSFQPFLKVAGSVV